MYSPSRLRNRILPAIPAAPAVLCPKFRLLPSPKSNLYPDFYNDRSIMFAPKYTFLDTIVYSCPLKKTKTLHVF